MSYASLYAIADQEELEKNKRYYKNAVSLYSIEIKPFFYYLKRYIEKVFILVSKFALYRRADGVFLMSNSGCRL